MSLSLYAQTDNNGSSSLAAIPQDQVIVEVANAVPAEYPLEAVEHNVQGAVSVSVVISEAGDVERALPEGGDALLQKSAVAAANQYKFKSRNGDSYIQLKCWAILSFNFQLQNSGSSSGTFVARPVLGQLIHGEQFPNKIRVSWTTMSRQAVKFADPLFAVGPKAAGAIRCGGTGRDCWSGWKSERSTCCIGARKGSQPHDWCPSALGVRAIPFPG